MPPLGRQSPINSSPSEELLSLQHAVSRLLPPTSASNSAPALAAAVFRASQRSIQSLHPASHAKDEIWHILRATAANPSASDIDNIYRLVVALQTRTLQPLLNLSFSKDGEELSEWNDHATAFFQQMALTSGVGQRVDDPRQNAAPPPASSSSTAASSSQNVASSSKSKFDPSWLRTRCAKLEVVRAGGLPAHEMAASVLTLLTDQTRSDDHLQSDLFDAFAGDFEAVGDVLSQRPLIRQYPDAIVADCSQAYELFLKGGTDPTNDEGPRARGVRRRTGRNERPIQTLGSRVTVRDVREETVRKEQVRDRRRLGKARVNAEESDNEEDDILRAQDFGGSAYEERQRAFPGVQMGRDAMIGAVDRVGLPKGSTRELGKGFEEIFVPPPERRPVKEGDLIEVASGLADHPELLRAMQGVKTLNRLQSAVFPIAFKTDENLLVCAPTGAGKTNVALLTIFREIVALKERIKRKFKVVYVAPMKALAAEVTEKFSQRLGPLGLSVKEYTGDMSLSRAESLATDVLVTTPEKWDVVTRKGGSELGNAITLFILDEIHLLHDDRGAVLESIVARTLRLSETAQRQIRLVGLSATLPNYADVGLFMRVNPKKGLFHFDGSHRPVPLSQTFIGISEGANSSSNEARKRKEAKVHEMAWNKVKDSLLRGHQCMIFVHSRKGTAIAAREMLSRASLDGIGNIFLGGKSTGSVSNSRTRKDGDDGDESGVMPSWAAKEISKSKTSDIRELCASGIGIHHAGLPRPDRKLVEKLFAEGAIRLLCCTATLAWGVNLPARSVIIMGTEVYNAEKGGFVQLGILDVMQIFGRAGRPQFDTEGEGTIITDHEHLGKYISQLTSSIPIESQLGASASRLADHLNAEIVSGTVSSVGDGVRWLSYTYLSVRMPQNPLVYGISWDEVRASHGLHSRRATLIDQASKALDDARMCRYDPGTGVLSPTDLGRVSSHFYVSHETIVLWSELLDNLPEGPAVSEHDWELVYSNVIHAVSSATEFEQMRSRQEEAEELESLIRTACPIPLKREAGSETREGKVAILLQAHISRAQIRMSDLSYIVQSATRLLRALFEISLRRAMPSFAVASLELARASESRIWPFQHPLWQFTYLARRERGLLVTPETVAAIEESADSDLATLRSKSREDLSILIRAPKIVQTVEKVLKAIPTLEIASAKVARLNSSLLSVQVSLVANFTWNDLLLGHMQSWWLWIEDKHMSRVYHSQKVSLTKHQVQALNADGRDGGQQQRGTLDYSFTVAVFAPASPRYWVRVESDRWHTGGGSTALLSVASLHEPREEGFKTSLDSISSGDARSILSTKEMAWFGDAVSQFNFVQMMTLPVAHQTDENILVAAPAGCGTMAIAEFAILRALETRKDAAVVFLSANKGELLIQEERWKKLSTFGQGKMVVLDERNYASAINGNIGIYSIILSTPQAWDDYSHNLFTEVEGTDHLEEDGLYGRVSLFILNDLHRLSNAANIGMELLVSRLNSLKKKQTSRKRGVVGKAVPRLVAVSAVLPNAAQIGDWLGVSRKTGLFCFGQELRQVPCEPNVVSVAGDRYGSRMQSMNLPIYSRIQRQSVKDPVLIFVSSRRQTILTAQDLLRLASLDGKEGMFVGEDKSASRHLRALRDMGLRQTVPQGIGLYHENLSSSERTAMETLFRDGRLQVLIATFDMASQIDARAQSVIVKGTEVFDTKKRRFEDVAVADIMNMIGHAGRPGIDKKCFTNVFVHEPKLTLVRLLLHEPLPVESSLIDVMFKEVLLREIVSKTFLCMDDCIDWLQNTFFYERLCTNPGYYGMKKKGSSQKDANNSKGLSRVRKIAETERRNEFAKSIVTTALKSLEELGLLELPNEPVGISGKKLMKTTRLTKTCLEWKISGESGRIIGEKVKECVSLEDVMEMVSSCEEMREAGLDYEEDAVWTKLFDRVGNGFVGFGLYPNSNLATKVLKINGWVESSQKRGKMLCYGLFLDGGGRGLESNNSKMETVFINARKLLEAGVSIAEEQAGSIIVIEQLVKAQQCLWSGCLQTSDIWKLCKIEGTAICQKGRSQGWKSVDDVMKDEQGFAIFIAKECSEVERSLVMRSVGALPSVEIRKVTLDKDGGCVSVQWRVWRKGSDGKDMRFWCNREGRFVVAVFREDDVLVGLKRASVGEVGQIGPNGVILDAAVDISAGTEVDGLSVWVGSEEWIGLAARRGVNE